MELGVKKGRHSRLESLDNTIRKPGFLVKAASLAGPATIDISVPDIVRIK